MTQTNTLAPLGLIVMILALLIGFGQIDAMVNHYLLALVLISGTDIGPTWSWEGKSTVMLVLLPAMLVTQLSFIAYCLANLIA